MEKDMVEKLHRILAFGLCTDPVQITKQSMRNITPIFARCYNFPPWLRNVFPFLCLIGLVEGRSGRDKKEGRKNNFDLYSNIIVDELLLLNTDAAGVEVNDEMTGERFVVYCKVIWYISFPFLCHSSFVLV